VEDFQFLDKPTASTHTEQAREEVEEENQNPSQ